MQRATKDLERARMNLDDSIAHDTGSRQHANIARIFLSRLEDYKPRARAD